jgi:hypothetical protein
MSLNDINRSRALRTEDELRALVAAIPTTTTST